MFMTPRRIQILGLVNPYLYIFSYMMDVFTHKGFPGLFLYEQLEKTKFSILTPRGAV